MNRSQSLAVVSSIVIAAACAANPSPSLGARPVQPPAVAAPVDPAATLPITPDLAASIGARVADLKTRGADCLAEAEVLDRALAGGHITIRPFMWRVGPNLASAQGESSGELTIARDIDSLNVGVRGIDDVLKSAEHEAVHIALHIPSGDSIGESLVDEHVRACRVPLSR